mgnify:CR=1 FL=1
MTTPTDNRMTTPWEEAGAHVVGALAGVHAVLVTGRDPDAAARAAIGIGRIESARRRVAIGDLVGDVAPLVALMDADDVHGVVDSFLYGVSLNRVAHPVGVEAERVSTSALAGCAIPSSSPAPTASAPSCASRS